MRVEDQTVFFEYDTDVNRHPCLVLPPQHPVLIARYQYYTSVIAARALGLMKAGVHTALTDLEWECRESLTSQHEDRGSCEVLMDDRRISFSILTASDDGHSATQMTCSGVEFSARDFDGWREKTRRGLPKLAANQEPGLASIEDVGLAASNGQCFVSRIARSNSGYLAQAWVKRKESFYPTNPLHEGSGDHVNAGQMFDCAMQTCHQILAPSRNGIATQPRCIAGRATFKKFVELDYPFSLRVQEAGGHEIPPDERRFDIEFFQAGQMCCNLSLRLDFDKSRLQGHGLGAL